MARLSPSELAELKQIPVAALARKRGIELIRRGEDLAGLCPFHKDKDASFIISEVKNLWNCFGCGQGGGPIDFVMEAEGVSFRHAAELLRAGVVTDSKSSTVRKLACPFDEETTGDALLNEVTRFYAETLVESPEALAYLARRGLGDRALIEHFQIGFANRTLGLRLPLANRKAGAAIRRHLTEIGILRSSGHEHLNGSVVVPFLNEHGHAVELYGRKIGERLKSGAATHLYLRGPHRGILNRAELVRPEAVILCEAPLDALSLWAAGIHNVTSSFGAGVLTAELFALLSSKRAVTIAFDADDAGERGTQEIAERLVAAGVMVSRVRFPRGMDANAMLMRDGPETLARRVCSSEWMGGKTSAFDCDDTEVVDIEVGDDDGGEDGDEVGGKQEDGSLDAGDKDEPLPLAAESTSTISKTSPHPAGAEPSGPLATPTPTTAPTPTTTPTPRTPTPKEELVHDEEKDEVRVTFGGRRYRVRGLQKNLAYNVMKVNVMVQKGEAFHVDSFDLYAAKARAFFVKLTASELRVTLETVRRDVGRLLFLLEQHQDKLIKEALAPKDVDVEMTEAERAEAMALLKSPDLLDQVLADFEAIGVVGEETNKLIGYLAAISRKLPKPLAVVVQSSSAAGKSSLMEAVLSFVPEEEKVAYSAMTGQSLFYMEDGNLKHKVLAIAEEEGAEQASYALKTLQSEGKLKIASTGKDPDTGRHVTSEYSVEGPVAIFTTTTAIDVDEELLNRCMVLTVNEEGEQTASIYTGQRGQMTDGGLQSAHKKTCILRRQQNAQRLIEPVHIVNNYAPFLTFPDHQVRLRRDHQKYLVLMSTIALVHQHQRTPRMLQTENGTVAVTDVEPADIDLANKLIARVLGSCLDELAPQTRRVFGKLTSLVMTKAETEGTLPQDVRFTRRQARESTGLSANQLHVHLTRLVELEYFVCERQHHSRTMEYAPVWSESESGAPTLVGLTSSSQAIRKYDAANLG